jgi:hypothetical protein
MIHRYTDLALLGDYLRAAAGLAVGFGLLFFTENSPILFYIALVLSLLFLAFAVRLAVRRVTVIAVDETGIGATASFGAAAPLGPTGQGNAGGRRIATRIDWTDMREVAVRYYSTRRDRSGGWMQLVVKAPGRRIAADSTIGEFPALVTAVTLAARRHGLELSPTTLANVGALDAPLTPRGAVRGEGR